MSKFHEKNLVILGLDSSDVMAEYRRLVAEEYERVMGVNVLMRFPRNLATLEGLRVHDLVVTERAPIHKNYADAHEILHRSLVMSTYRQETSD